MLFSEGIDPETSDIPRAVAFVRVVIALTLIAAVLIIGLVDGSGVALGHNVYPDLGDKDL